MSLSLSSHGLDVDGSGLRETYAYDTGTVVVALADATTNITVYFSSHDLNGALARCHRIVAEFSKAARLLDEQIMLAEAITDDGAVA